MPNSFGELFHAFFNIGFVGFANGVDGEFHFIVYKLLPILLFLMIFAFI
jgi:hypothetical protein